MTQFVIKVIPKSGKSELKFDGDILKVWLKSVPEDGKANAELIRTLAEFLNISRADVRILRGLSSKNKVVDIQGITVEEMKKAAH